MAALVQVFGSVQTASAFATTQTASFGSLPTVGNYVVVGAAFYRASSAYQPSRVFDNQNNYYQNDVISASTAGETTASIWRSKVRTSSGTFTISLAPVYDSASNYVAWSAAEFSGLESENNVPYPVGALPGGPVTVSASTTGDISRTLQAGSIWIVLLIQTGTSARNHTIATTGLTWSDVVNGTTLIAEGSNNRESHMWWTYDSAGGARTATITASASNSWLLWDIELQGIDSSAGDVAAVNNEAGTNTTHTVTGQNTHANGGFGVVLGQSNTGSPDDVIASRNWQRLLGGDGTLLYYGQTKLAYAAITSETGEFIHTTARQFHTIMAFFKAANAGNRCLDQTGTNNATTGDANVTASGANTTTSGLALAVAAVNHGDNDINIGDTPPSGWTNIAFYENSNLVIGFSFDYRIYSSSETSSAQWTHDNVSPAGWAAALITLKDVIVSDVPFSLLFSQVFTEEYEESVENNLSTWEHITIPEWQNQELDVFISEIINENNLSYSYFQDLVAADPDIWLSQELDEFITESFEFNDQLFLHDVAAPVEDFWNQNIDTEYDFSHIDIIDVYQIPFFQDDLYYWNPQLEQVEEIVLDEYQFSDIISDHIVVDAGPDNDNWGNTEEDFTPDIYSGEDINQSFFIPSAPVPTFGLKHSLGRLYLLEARLDVRLETDEGTVSALASDGTGTTVTFNKAFKDISSITVSVLDTVEKKVIFDFTDVPNPTTFKVLVFDTAGARVNATVHWIARGVL